MRNCISISLFFLVFLHCSCLSSIMVNSSSSYSESPLFFHILRLWSIANTGGPVHSVGARGIRTTYVQVGSDSTGSMACAYYINKT